MKDSSRNAINPALSEAFQQSSASKMYRSQNADAFDAVHSKMVRGETTDKAIKDTDNPVTSLQDPFLKTAVAKSIERIQDNNNILQVLPDIKLAIEIIIGGILSPKDLMKTTLTFTSNNEAFDERAVTLLGVVEDYFVSSYKLKDELPKMLRDILAKTGSYPLAVLPETSVDYIINSNSRVTLEDLKTSVYTPQGKIQPMGLLANRRKDGDMDTEVDPWQMVSNVSSESFGLFTQEAPWDGTIGDSILKLSVIDNYDGLKLPEVKRKISAQATQDKLLKRQELLENYRKTHVKNPEVYYSSEAMRPIDSSDPKRDRETIKDLNKLYPERTWKATPILRVKPRSSLEKPTFGHPTVIKLPTESVIPVYSPNDPSDHLGYFVALDNTGNAIRLAELDDLYRNLTQSSNASSGANVTSWLLQNSANGMSNGVMNQGANDAVMAFAQAVPIYQHMVESELLDRLERGTLGAGVSLGKTDDLYRLMLARALSGKHTQLLYIPASLLSYIAIDWDEFGLGKTLLDESKTLAALRSMQMFINSMAASKNAITRRVLNVALDPAEKDPQRASEIILHEFAKGTQGEYPLTNNPADQINYLQKAGVQINFEEHPRLPNTKVSVDYNDNNYLKVDTDFDDWLKKMHTMSLGLPQEVVEGAGSADFATQTIYANVMTARRIMIISEAFCQSLSGFVRRYVYNSQILMDNLIDLIKSNNIKFRNQFNEEMSDAEVATKFVESIEVSLPPPDTTSIKEQKEAFTEMADLIELGIEHFFNSEMFSEEEIGRLGGSIDSTKSFMKSHFMRDWMKTNGILPELFDLVAQNRDGTPVIDLLEMKSQYMEIISKSILPSVKAAMTRSSNINNALDKHEQGLNLDSGGGDYDSGSTDADTGGDFGDDFGGDDDFDAGLDMETTTETETTTEETTEPDGDSEDTTDDADDQTPPKTE